MAITLLVGVHFELTDDALIEVQDSLRRGKVPSTPLKQHPPRTHRYEKHVQSFLNAQGLPGSSVYQSVFVFDTDGERIPRQTVENFGDAFVVRTGVIAELAVASLGDMQNVVHNLPDHSDHKTRDDRFINLSTSIDIEAALLELTSKAAIHNAKKRTEKIYVEARVYRRLINKDLLRPCTDNDFAPKRRLSFRCATP